MSGSVLIKDLEFYWAKLSKPVSPFGTLQWELQVRTTDRDTKAQLEDAGVKVKVNEDDDGNTYYSAGLKRKAVDKKGNDMSPPRVVDGARQEIDGDSIGNGSRGNVILFSYDYDVMGKKGKAAMISAVQVTQLVKYTSKSDVDFDIEETIEVSTPNADDAVDFG